MFAGESVGARRVRLRRGRLHDVDDRLPGDRHRPELRRARSSASPRRWSATTASTSGAPSRSRIACHGGRDARGPRPGVDRLAARARHRRADRRRHPLARPAPARAGRDARRRGRRRRRRRRGARRRSRASRRWRAPRSSRPSRPPEPYTFADDGRRARRRRRLRHASARSCGCVAVARRGGRRLPARRRRRHARRLRRRAPRRNGPGDPAPLDGEVATVPRAARPHAGARRLPRPPAARARHRQDDLQAAVRPPRREPSGARPPHAAASSSRRRTTASPSRPATSPETRTARSTTGRSRASPSPSCARSRRSSIPRRRPGPHDGGVDHRRAGSRS